MQHNVAQLLKEPIGATREQSIEADIAVLDEDLELRRPLSGRVHLLRTDAGILVQGRVQTEIEVFCSRCLTRFALPLEATLEEEFRPRVDIATRRKTQGDVEDSALVIDEHHILDLWELIRQQLLLALPLHPLCRPDCAGLCPQCGKNLNEGPCECTKEMDPRWAVLQAWQPG